jgi:hypothetical protein
MELIYIYLEAAVHGVDVECGLFRPIKNNTHSNSRAAIARDGVYEILRGYSTSPKEGARKC